MELTNSQINNTNSQIKFKTSMLRTTWCDYSNAYVLLSRTITITGAGNDDAARQLDEINKGVISKNCVPFTDCICEINNTQKDNAKYIDFVIPMCNLIEYGNNYSKKSGSLWQYYKDNPDDTIAESESFKCKIKMTRKTPAAGTIKDAKIVFPLKYLSNFWRTLEMLLIHCEINLILTCSEDCVIFFLQPDKQNLK